MLYSLVKKDFILAKNYLLFTAVFAVAAPIFLNAKISSALGNFLGFLAFLITVLFAEYTLFNLVSSLEYKYRGPALLCATPYTRSTLVKARYLFLLVVFACCYIIYIAAAVLAPVSMPMLSLSSAGISLLITAIYFGIVIPLQYRFGYEKTRYISFFLIFICPFVLPYVAKWMQSSNISFNVELPFPQLVQDLLPGLLALVIGFISMNISIRIYSKKNL